MIFIKHIHYLFFEIFILILNNIKHSNQFLIITPRIFSYFFKNVFIYNFKKKKLFSQRVRNFYDINTSLRGGILYPALDPSIFEIKFPNSDIKGKVLGDNLGVRE